jgi:UDP-N-acetylmuramyl pentapeptide synthase
MAINMPLAAIEAGAAYAVVSEEMAHPKCILVEDTLTALQALAHQSPLRP